MICRAFCRTMSTTSIHGELARTLFMAAGWGINLALVEWILLRERRSN